MKEKQNSHMGCIHVKKIKPDSKIEDINFNQIPVSQNWTESAWRNVKEKIWTFGLEKATMSKWFPELLKFQCISIYVVV